MAAAKGIGVFSDIHGNRRAFAAVIQIIKQRQDLEWLCLGDVVGWFFRPVQCVLMLKELVNNGFVAGVIPGNHDLMALDIFADDPRRIDRMLATAFSAGMLAQCPEAEAFLRSLRCHTIERQTLRGQTRLSNDLNSGSRRFPVVDLNSCEWAGLPRFAGRKVESDP